MSLSILFIDIVAYKPYDANTLQKEALGGSEASLIRVARGLARRGHDVSVFQAVDAHREEVMIKGVRHVHDSSELNPDVVVHFRTGELVDAFREQYPKARHLMWAQDFFNKESVIGLDGEEIICLSDAHKAQIEQTFASCFQVESFRLKMSTPKAIHKIYNIVEVDGAKLDKVPGRLGFFSSPHKGLDQVLSLFQKIKKPGMELVIGNPGYLGLNGHAVQFDDPGVTVLGELSHPRVMEELSKCEALFYPQTVFPETFGIILAEANAMGVPVLCHDFGAAKEMVKYGHVVDCTDSAMVKRCLDDILDRAQNGAPKPQLHPEFTESAVIDQWEALLVQKE